MQSLCRGTSSFKKAPRPLPLSALTEEDHIGRIRLRIRGRPALAEEARRYVPLSSVIGDDRDRFLIVASQHAFEPPLTRRLERNPITDPELQHLDVSSHLAENAEPGDDAMVEVDQ